MCSSETRAVPVYSMTCVLLVLNECVTLNGSKGLLGILEGYKKLKERRTYFMAGIAMVLGINIKGCNSGPGLTGGIF